MNSDLPDPHSWRWRKADDPGWCWTYAATTRKEDHDLIAETRKAGYTSTLITIEVGSRGLPNMSWFQRHRDILKLRHPEFVFIWCCSVQEALQSLVIVWQFLWSQQNTVCIVLAGHHGSCLGWRQKGLGRHCLGYFSPF